MLLFLDSFVCRIQQRWTTRLPSSHRRGKPCKRVWVRAKRCGHLSRVSESKVDAIIIRAGGGLCVPNPSMAAEPRVPHLTGYSKQGLQGFPLHITKRAQQIRDSIVFELVTPEDVLAFIHAIEKAEQYFAVKDYVKEMPVVKEQGCVSYNVKVDTAKELEEGDKYDKLGHEEIVHALNAVDLEVEPRYAYINLRGKKPNRDHVSLMPVERLDSYLHTHPLCHLVFETRTKGRVLDVDPTVELKKLMKTASFLHYGLFNIDRRFKEKTLTFSGDTLDEEEIKAKLSKCGKIERVKLKSLKKLAHVTFRDFAGTDEAVGLVVSF